MAAKFIGNAGTSIQIVTGKIRNELQKRTNPSRKERTIKLSEKLGVLTSKDWKHISLGLEVLGRLMNETFRIQENEMLSGEKDVSRVKKELVGYRAIMDDFIWRISIGARDEYEIQRRIEALENYSQIAQAARDGIIIKQDKRTEKIDGELREVAYDTSMSLREVVDTLKTYERQADRLMYTRLSSYLGLGLGLAGMIGTLIKKESTKDGKTGNLTTLGTVAITGMKLIQGIQKNEEREKIWEMKDKEARMTNDLLGNEQISCSAKEDAIEEITMLIREGAKLGNKIENKRVLFEICMDLAVAIISGIYINRNVQIRENGKIDGKSLAAAIVSLQATKGIASNFMRAAQGIQESRREEQEFKQICKKVDEILLQMEQKVYPLKGAKAPFDSMEIKQLNAQFYLITNYTNGETKFATTIQIPEFSMKRGDVVLLSGDSGSGKSTFLRLLKRGDINNRSCITLDNGEKVDNLGNEYISFRPSINLGDETNVLFQITGKTGISNLNEKEREQLMKILSEIGLDPSVFLEQLARKKITEFSTGEQRRLALSKLFYRIDDGTSVMIVDEPVGNVEENLIRDQLEMIRKYAQEKKIMLLLTTHRLDLAEGLATKRYHINKSRVLEQVPLVNGRGTPPEGR